ncbi:hypothetical protein ALC57_11308, partial [Trachymyrmex cornetzi]
LDGDGRSPRESAVITRATRTLGGGATKRRWPSNGGRHRRGRCATSTGVRHRDGPRNAPTQKRAASPSASSGIGCLLSSGQRRRPIRHRSFNVAAVHVARAARGASRERQIDRNLISYESSCHWLRKSNDLFRNTSNNLTKILILCFIVCHATPARRFLQNSKISLASAGDRRTDRRSGDGKREAAAVRSRRDELRSSRGPLRVQRVLRCVSTQPVDRFCAVVFCVRDIGILENRERVALPG